MSRLSRRAVLATGVLPVAAMLPVSAIASVGLDNWRNAGFEALSSQASALVSSSAVAGFAVGVSARGFRKMSFAGLADIDENRPVSRDTLFRIASVTKPFTAACSLRLVESGALSLDQTIDRYFPDFPRGSEITIYQLLSHTSGLRNWWGALPLNAPPQFLSSGEAHRWFAQMRSPFVFAPGSAHEYSNTGYVLLGEIIERATGLSFLQALEETVLSRVGAGATELEAGPSTKTSWAVGYAMEGAGQLPMPTPPMPFAAGGLRATLHDVLAFSDALFHGKLLSDAHLKLMTSEATVADGRPVSAATYDGPEALPQNNPPDASEMGYGLGINTWVQAGERFYSHSGLIDGFGAYLVYAPRTRTTIAMMSNTMQGTASLHEAARRILIGAPT